MRRALQHCILRPSFAGHTIGVKLFHWSFHMAHRKPLLFSILLSAAGLLLASKDYWEQPFEKWKREDVVRMLNDSPWAQNQTFNQVAGGINSGQTGERE